MENDEQDTSYVRRQYGKVSDNGNDRIKGEGNRHSYFLRAKTPRGELKKPYSSFYKQLSPSEEEEDLAKCLVMLSNSEEESKGKDVFLEKGMFQCKACKKVFNSHQALGGHRASHKKVKGCFASKLDDDDDQAPAPPPPPPPESDTSRKRGYKMHECSVCRRVFSSGQALGGHKRCHWLTTMHSSDNAAFIQLCKKPVFTITNRDQLDLNLNLPPAPQQYDDHHHHKTRLCLQEWANQNQHKNKNLSDLSLDGGWLQMGIAPTTEFMS